MSKTDASAFLNNVLIVEEKIDGANLGISFDHFGNIRLQNRGKYLQAPYVAQWKKLENWLALRTERLFDGLTDKYILFCEWCYAKHSVFYNQLPDWCIGFDVYDKKNRKYLSCQKRNSIFQEIGIIAIPFISRGHFSLLELQELLSSSVFGDTPAEGIYLRFDKGDWLTQRAKLVRPEFMQDIGEHWSRRGIIPNHLISVAQK